MAHTLRHQVAWVVASFIVISRVCAFSAKLPRPWEPPKRPSASLLTRKRRKREELAVVYLTSTPKQEMDDDTTGEAYLNGDDEETMMLQPRHQQEGNDYPSSDDTVAQHHSNYESLVHSSTSPPSSTPTEQPTVTSSLGLLFGMTRPSNFPGVVLLHILGVHLALQSPHIVGNARLLPTLLRPSMMVVLVCLLLTSAASMVVNDYFDYKIGVDAEKLHKPLVGGTVTMAVAKKFLYYIYSAIALLVTVVPGVPARLLVVIGNMLTYWYTRHLKPVTWLKNAVCATVMALSPATSGAAAFHLLSTQSSLRVFQVSALSRLVATLFVGFVGREILMDINDVEDDRAHEVRTVPVARGRKFASKAALLCTSAMTACCIAGPVCKLAQSGVGDYLSWRAMLSTILASPGGATRQLLLAILGCLPMLHRAWAVYDKEGEDREVTEKAIEEGKLTFMFILASFV